LGYYIFRVSLGYYYDNIIIIIITYPGKKNVYLKVSISLPIVSGFYQQKILSYLEIIASIYSRKRWTWLASLQLPKQSMHGTMQGEELLSRRI